MGLGCGGWGLGEEQEEEVVEERRKKISQTITASDRVCLKNARFVLELRRQHLDSLSRCSNFLVITFKRGSITAHENSAVKTHLTVGRRS